MPDPAPSTFRRYNADWKIGTDPLRVEFACIKRGGKWTMPDGRECGEGLFAHYKAAQELLWPDDYHHRWSDLELSEILNNTITVITGPKDTGKTHVALVRYGLTDYFAFPDNTLIVVSSTTLAALEGRVWGDMKNMWQKAKDRYPWLAGNPIDSRHAICTDDLGDEENIRTRDMRKGIICVPCRLSSGQFNNGISSYVGMKQERRRHLGDEFQFMSPAMMESIANMNSGDYKGIFTGNPIGQNDPLDRMSEPKDGWDSFPEPKTTTVWENRRFLKSRTICLFGPDSPNFDEPQNRYKGLINQDSIDRVVAGYGKDSHHYYSQCLGVRKAGLNARRVITRALCRDHKAFDDVIWQDVKRTKIAACDAAYGGTGSDRCVAGHIEFGQDVEKKLIILIHPPQVIPVSIRNAESSEDQIAKWVKFYCETNGIPPENFFYDSTGRGSLGPALARNWSALIQPVEFGGSATSRIVSLDAYIIDPKTGQRRLQLCNEAYSRFITELWWTSRAAVEAEQVRGLTEELCDEGSAREWKLVAGNRIEVETKLEMRERCGYSPDMYDWWVTALEGARRRGFTISKLANDSQRETSVDSWIEERSRSLQEIHKKAQLNYAA